MRRFIESPMKRRFQIWGTTQNLACHGQINLTVPQKSQNKAIDTQRGKLFSLSSEDFDFVWSGNVALAATQHHSNW